MDDGDDLFSRRHDVVKNTSSKLVSGYGDIGEVENLTKRKAIASPIDEEKRKHKKRSKGKKKTKIPKKSSKGHGVAKQRSVVVNRGDLSGDRRLKVQMDHATHAQIMAKLRHKRKKRRQKLRNLAMKLRDKGKVKRGKIPRSPKAGKSAYKKKRNVRSKITKEIKRGKTKRSKAAKPGKVKRSQLKRSKIRSRREQGMDKGSKRMTSDVKRSRVKRTGVSRPVDDTKGISKRSKPTGGEKGWCTTNNC